jgi:hypothetical protein
MTRLLTTLLGFALLAAAAPTCAGDPEPAHAKTKAPMESVLVSRLEGSLVIDVDGSVDSFQIDTPMIEGLRAGVERAVSSWRFNPVLLDGKPVRASYPMILTLAGTRIGEGYNVKIDNAVFPLKKPGETKPGYSVDTPSSSIVIRDMHPPMYPTDMMRAGISGTVLVAFRIGADGRVAEASSVQTMLFDLRGRDRVMQQIVRQFERVAVSSVKDWTFVVTAKTGAPAVADMTQYVPIAFLMEGVQYDPKPGKWRTVVRDAVKRPAWLPAEEKTKVGVADLSGGQMLSPDPRLVPTTNVAGTDVM